MILATKKVAKMLDNTIPLKVTPVIEEFSDFFPEDLPNKLSPMCDI